MTKKARNNFETKYRLATMISNERRQSLDEDYEGLSMTRRVDKPGEEHIEYGRGQAVVQRWENGDIVMAVQGERLAKACKSD
jgi:hypothetical protein